MDLKTILTEEINKVIDEAYPVQFDIKSFSQISSFAKRIEYCNQHLMRLGNGSSRIAYRVDDEKVLKIAKNAKGVAQNENELMWTHQRYDIVARTFESDRNDLWLEMELATKLTPKRFRQLTNVDIKDMQSFIQAMRMERYDEVDILLNQKYEDNDFFLNWYNFLNDHSYDKIMDYAILTSFGEVLRDGRPEVVIIDIGINDDILNSFYRRR